jgi:hypothetical protein
MISNWLGISTLLQNEGLSHLDLFEGLIGSGRVFTDRHSVIWFVGIWKARNNKLFNNKEVHLKNITESVK